jgi:riboflavin transporter FmnP
LNAKSISLIIVFASLAIVLNTIRIPTIYWPNMIYTFSGIPVLVSFLLYGFKIGFMVEIIHILGQEIFFPVGPAGVVTYPLGIFVFIFMFSGIYCAYRLIKNSYSLKKESSEKKNIGLYTFFSVCIRGGFMPIIDYAVFYSILLPIALGIDIPQDYILTLVPGFIIYNITTALYSVPIAYLLARKTSKYLKIHAKFLISL